MISRSRLLLVFVMALFVAGCSGMVRLSEVDGQHFVDRPLTKDQVKEAIMEGAQAADGRQKTWEVILSLQPIASECIRFT
jgi:hypothetical protein